MTAQPVSVGGAELAVTEQGAGEPVVFVHGGLVADAFAPVCRELGEGRRLIRYHRRGYAASSGSPGPVSIERDAADCLALLDALDIRRAHLVGWSYGGAVVLEAAVRAPGRLVDIALLEPALLEVPGAAELAGMLAPMFARYAAGDVAGAAADFQVAVWGPDWARRLEQQIPGGVAQLYKDAALVFESDLPALQAFSFGLERAAALDRPVLSVAGTDSLPIVTDVRERVRALLPQTEEVLIDGADHSFAVTRPVDVAAALAAFWGRHPGGSGGE